MILLAMTLTLGAWAQRADYRVVPLPAHIAPAKGDAYRLTAATRIVYQGGADMARNAKFLAAYISEKTHIAPTTATADKHNQRGNILLRIDPKVREAEGYRLEVTGRGVVIAGSTPQGVFYGIQTLRKSLPILTTAAEVTLPATVITDAPRFGYRGMHLDCARHFFTVDFIKEYIDLLALHNMNRFHWHLTDDQGWRVEIKKYPRLTQVGAWRTGTTVGRNSDIDDGQRYGGYYTQEQIREVVQYAADRYITIIPEIDMPGHMLAALAAYPELGCTGGPYEVGHFWGVYRDILCGGNPRVYQFAKDILDEVCSLFPSEYIHIGGDEAPKMRWAACAKCQQAIRDLGIKAEGKQTKEDRLQGYFAMDIQKYLAAKGRKIIGWDELLECNVDKSATIMSWQGAEPGAQAAALGHEVIMTPNSYAYFDYYQTDKKNNEPLCIGGTLPIAKTYSFEPVPATATPEVAARILGVQANLWTEYLSSPQLVEYQVLPRMGALSEVQWMAPEAKDYNDFVNRVEGLRTYYELRGYTYAKHLWPELYLKGSRGL